MTLSMVSCESVSPGPRETPDSPVSGSSGCDDSGEGGGPFDRLLDNERVNALRFKDLAAAAQQKLAEAERVNRDLTDQIVELEKIQAKLKVQVENGQADASALKWASEAAELKEKRAATVLEDAKQALAQVQERLDEEMANSRRLEGLYAEAEQHAADTENAMAELVQRLEEAELHRQRSLMEMRVARDDAIRRAETAEEWARQMHEQVRVLQAHSATLEREIRNLRETSSTKNMSLTTTSRTRFPSRFVRLAKETFLSLEQMRRSIVGGRKVYYR